MSLVVPLATLNDSQLMIAVCELWVIVIEVPLPLGFITGPTSRSELAVPEATVPPPGKVWLQAAGDSNTIASAKASR